MKCQTHSLNHLFYCDTCQVMLCKTCLAQNDHDAHKIYGLGALKELPINEKISRRAAELEKMSGRLKENEKQLNGQKALCETYLDEIEKIYATEIGKTLLAHMGKNKEELVEVCQEHQ